MWLVGGSVSLGKGFEVSDAHARFRVSLSAYRSGWKTLSYFSSTMPILPAAILPAIMVMDS